jgi:transcriptional regulator with XRE-family HTH domain
MSIPNGYIERMQRMDNYYPRLRDLREDHDLSQQQVAEYLGMKQPQYNRYERGLRDIPTDVLIRLAKLYQTSTDYILGLTNRSKKSEK